MNKITPKDYAIGLIESVRGKRNDEIKIVADKFVSLLVENNDLSKSQKIIDTFSSLWNKENKIVESEITTTEKLDDKALNSLKSFLIEVSGAKEAVINEKIDRDILGGAIIKYDDKVLDKSLKTKVKKLNNLIKS